MKEKTIKILLLIGVVLILVLFAFIIAPDAAEPKPSEILNCQHPEGYEYTCYDKKECDQYLEGYSAVLSDKIYWQKDPHPVVWMNLYMDYSGLLLVGKIYIH